jgi:hypothetical protein
MQQLPSRRSPATEHRWRCGAHVLLYRSDEIDDRNVACGLPEHLAWTHARPHPQSDRHPGRLRLHPQPTQVAVAVHRPSAPPTHPTLALLMTCVRAAEPTQGWQRSSLSGTTILDRAGGAPTTLNWELPRYPHVPTVSRAFYSGDSVLGGSTDNGERRGSSGRD